MTAFKNAALEHICLDLETLLANRYASSSSTILK